MLPIPALLTPPSPAYHAAEGRELLRRRLEESGQMRTTSEILYGCIITIILCSSYCIRPNLSYPNASNIKVLRRKLNVTFWMVLCPELIIIWAFKQWRQANTFASKYIGMCLSIQTNQYFSMESWQIDDGL